MEHSSVAAGVRKGCPDSQLLGDRVELSRRNEPSVSVSHSVFPLPRGGENPYTRAPGRDARNAATKSRSVSGSGSGLVRFFSCRFVWTARSRVSRVSNAPTSATTHHVASEVNRKPSCSVMGKHTSMFERAPRVSGSIGKVHCLPIHDANRPARFSRVNPETAHAPFATPYGQSGESGGSACASQTRLP